MTADQWMTIGIVLIVCAVLGAVISQLLLSVWKRKLSDF